MAVIIGAATQASFGGSSCIISANWGYSPNIQRLYCIGEWEPDSSRVFYRPTETLNVTIYSPGPTYSTEASTSCSMPNTINASISPATCGETAFTLSGDWLVTGYSFTKEDGSLPGQESWSLTRWNGVSGGHIEPTYVLRGLCEGQGTPNSGIEFATGGQTQTRTGSVSANSFGKSETLTMGVVLRVGGGDGSASGETGQGSVSMPYTPLYI